MYWNSQVVRVLVPAWIEIKGRTQAKIKGILFAEK
jgi:hypothetical protein